MIQNHDLFFDYHIDSLKWLDYPFNWSKYFTKFPNPEINPINDKGDYIVLHLISSTSLEHRMESWYINNLIQRLQKQLNEKKIKIYIISTPEINQIYNASKNLENVFIFNGNIKEVCDLIVNAKGMISTDSGFRFIAYGCNIPTISFSKQCSSPGQIPISHILRWNPYPQTMIPLNYDSGYVTKLFNKILDNPLYLMYPELCNCDENLLSQVLIKRNYKVNLEKSILS
jgi:ADP-heptose:LPS heptosyltransferase